MTTTIRIEEDVRDRLQALAARRYGAGVSLGAAVDRLVTEAEQEQILAAYSALRADPAAWADYTGELVEWDATTGDGIGRG
jgi:predicted transcriptional regulator